MADERKPAWLGNVVRRIRPRRVPEDQVRVQPIAAAGWMIATILAVIGATAGVWLWLLGVADQAAPGTDRAQARLSAARIALAAGGGTGAGVGLMLAFRRQRHQEIATVITDRDAVERRINDRYTTAIDQLGSDKIDVRLGGIYALERIATDSPRDHPTIIDVLCTFVREHTRNNTADDSDPVLASWMAAEKQTELSGLAEATVRADIQATVTAIGRLNTESASRYPDLAGAILAGVNLLSANLAGANLAGANLARANFTGANLSNANLYRTNLNDAHLVNADLTSAKLMFANLDGANLIDANLSRAYLRGAHLRGAHMTDANLIGANLSSAKLRGAHLEGANLSGAFLIGANLRGADLDDASLDGANLRESQQDASTQWPEGFQPPPAV